MKNYAKFMMRIKEPFSANYALPPEDPLGELTEFELALRVFCYECDHLVQVEIADMKFHLHFDPDICMLFQDDRLPEQIGDLQRGKSMRIEFCESYRLTVILVSHGDEVICHLSKFYDQNFPDQFYVLEKKSVLSELKSFLNDVLSMAVDRGYISLADKDDFIAPAFPERLQSQILV
jgi:hypothetical protein